MGGELYGLGWWCVVGCSGGWSGWIEVEAVEIVAVDTEYIVIC